MKGGFQFEIKPIDAKSSFSIEKRTEQDSFSGNQRCAESHSEDIEQRSAVEHDDSLPSAGNDEQSGQDQTSGDQLEEDSRCLHIAENGDTLHGDAESLVCDKRQDTQYCLSSNHLKEESRELLPHRQSVSSYGTVDSVSSAEELPDSPHHVDPADSQIEKPSSTTYRLSKHAIDALEPVNNLCGLKLYSDECLKEQEQNTSSDEGKPHEYPSDSSYQLRHEDASEESEESFRAQFHCDYRNFLFFPSIPEVRAKAPRRVKQIFTDWSFLSTVIQTHEALIRKRWQKKSVAHRKKILLSAWPDMPQHHRPDVDAYKTRSQRSSEECKKDAYILPYMNLDDLSGPKLLLIFLNSRARHHPGVFARVDYCYCFFASDVKAIWRAETDGWAMRLDQTLTAETYGEIHDHDKLHVTLENFEACEHVGAGVGLWVLDVQEKILSFLKALCLLVLHDFPVTSLLDPTATTQAEPESLSTSISNSPSITTFLLEAQYQCPSEFNVEHLKSIVEGKLAAAEDHLWALREDPGYMAQAFWDHDEHSAEHLPDANGQRSPIDKEVAWRDEWEAMLAPRVVRDAIMMVRMWRGIRNQCIELWELRRKHAEHIHPCQRLPVEYETAYLRLIHHLRSYQGIATRRLRGFFASIPIRGHAYRRTNKDFTIGYATKSGKGPKEKLIMDMCWMVNCLLGECHLDAPPSHIIIDGFSRLAEDNKMAKNLLTAWVAEEFANVAVISLCRFHVGQYHPSTAMLASSRNKCGSLCKEFKDEWTAFCEMDGSKERIWTSQLGVPRDGKFEYPVDKKRTPENVRKLIQAEQNLDKFWMEMSQNMLSGEDVQDLLVSVFSGRQLSRTTGFEQPKPSLSPSENSNTSICTDVITFPQYQDWERELLTEKTVTPNRRTEPRSKTKTHGSPGPAHLQPSKSINNNHKMEDKRPAKFVVEQRALKVFENLFHVPSSASRMPGEIPWAEFLHAMTKIGFSAQKLWGSAWQFVPTAMHAGQSFQCHEPHPGNKLPFTTARRIGRRLTRMYGWDGSCFELQ